MTQPPTPKKSLGQHWLNDKKTLDNICSIARLSKDDVALEIGPGLGSLTELLLKQAGSVVAVELDNMLSARLKATFNTDKLTIINESILTFDLTSLPTKYKVVANIPYYLTSNLLRVLSESSNPPELIVLLIQKEVAERVAAAPGDMSLLSVTTQFYWEVKLGDIVPAIMFTPPPKVDSQIILLERRKKVLFPGVEIDLFFRIVKFGYSSRRKTILNSLASGLRIDKQATKEVLNEAKVDTNARPQTLSLDEWHDIYEVCLTRKLI